MGAPLRIGAHGLRTVLCRRWVVAVAEPACMRIRSARITTSSYAYHTDEPHSAGLVGLGFGAVLAAAAAAAASSAVPMRPAACEAATTGAILPEVVDAIPSEVDLKDSRVRLYQFESCPFCRKVRSCLDFHGIPYQVVEVNPLSKAETREIAPDYGKVPILRIDTKENRQFQLRESKTIVFALLGATNPGVLAEVEAPTATASTSKMWTESDATGKVEEQWLRWTDRVLVQCIVLNVYRTMGESAETFRYLLTHPDFPWYARKSAALSGTVVMWGVAKARTRKFAVADQRAALYEAINSFAAAVHSGGGRFLGGSRPGAVDFNVYGILRSAEGCQTERDFLESCPSILPWYHAMSEATGPTRAINAESIRRGV